VVGGTAIASLFEHRHSHDLDLFASRGLEPAMRTLVRTGAFDELTALAVIRSSF
jgi:hypothetical protein